MFHHQKSSRSSDENLEINLLRTRNRQSGVNFVRVNHNNIRLNRSKRGSAHVPRSGQFSNDLDNNIYDNYSALDHVDFSQSLLTSPNESSPVVGVILFILLVAFIPIETLALCATQQKLEIYFILSMLEWLLICEIISFAILYKCGWVEPISILTTYLRSQRQLKDQPTTLLLKLVSQPYLLFALILILTMVWQISYANAIIGHGSIAHLLLLYFIILPEIVGSLCYEEELTQDRVLKLVFYGGTAYLCGWGLAVDVWVGLGGVSGILLICLSIRLGRVILFMQYISKLMMLILVGGLHLYGYLAQDPPEELAIESMADSNTILFLILTTFSIIMVRCINNKILRVQLYKYFYSDQTINNILLCLPVVAGYLENQELDVWVGVGCGVLLLVSYLIGRKKQEININLNEGEEGKERELRQIR